MFSFVRILFLCLFFGTCILACGREKPTPKLNPTPNTIFIVLDTIRSDHMGLCGYKKATTKNTERIISKYNAKYTCDGVAPGSWTLPSHASFFTGVDPVTHRCHSITGTVNDDSGWGSANRILDKKLPTLAEKMGKKGYQTVAVSANPVVNETLGLMRGFEKANVTKAWGHMFGDKLLTALETTLKEVSRKKPLFLFINIADGHRPWKTVPEGLGWVDPQQRIYYVKSNPENWWRRYVEKRMSPSEEASFKIRLQDLYDYALFRADGVFGQTVDYLYEDGWCKDGCRFVVVSDHGEFLGEHQLLDHGHYVWEETIRVPVITWGFDDNLKLPSVMSATHAYHLVLNGALPDKLLPPTSMAWPHIRRCNNIQKKAYCSTSAAIWTEDHQKLLFMDGETSLINLKTDPYEMNRKPLTEHHLKKELDNLAKKVVGDRIGDKQRDNDEEVFKQLKALGYMD